MKQPRRPTVAISLILVFMALHRFFAAGYGMMFLIYRWTGTPPDFWAHILSGLMGIILFAVLATIFRLIVSRFGNSVRGSIRLCTVNC